MPAVRSLVSKYCTYIVALILLLSKVMLIYLSRESPAHIRPGHLHLSQDTYAPSSHDTYARTIATPIS